jgi:penicillin-binding protein 1C
MIRRTLQALSPRAARALSILTVVLSCVCVAAALPLGALIVTACLLPLPEALSHAAAGSSRAPVAIVDRHGQLLREVTLGSGAPLEPVALEELAPGVVPALLAAEDKRFFAHAGIDPLALARASLSLVLERRIVSGGSTLTQQLARHLEPRPRTFRGKWREMALSLRLEASLSKAQILEQYLSRIEFGPSLYGMRAASREYFQKSPAALDLAEASTLIAVARGPALYDPSRRPALALRRRLRILERLRELGIASEDELRRAELSPLSIERGLRPQGSAHLGFAIAKKVAAETSSPPRLVRTTLDARLQRQAENIAVRAETELAAHQGSAVSLVVLDNESGGVLAYVGSPDYFDRARLGANDGVTALRQPGSTLKPFVYAAALSELSATPATLLSDLPRAYAVPGGYFTPRNYDHRHRGPVLLRQALASSLNVTAVDVAARLGPARLLGVLHDFGFASLHRSAEHYGVALALGDGEVTLLELAGAYAALAHGGEWRSPRFISERVTSAGQTLREPPAEPRRVLAPALAALVSDMLSDDAARTAGFGRESVLAFDFPVAAKTGTSKGFRDNWVLGYSSEVTVGVWAGNFDGAPLRDASGLTLSGPVFRELMLAAMEGRTARPLFDASLLERAEVCSLSGARPSPDCANRRLDSFAKGRVPSASCTLHVRATLTAQGHLADPSCSAGPSVVVEHWPAPFVSWALEAGRAHAARPHSPTCPPRSLARAALGSAARARDLVITYPHHHQIFRLDSDAPDRQEILLSAEAPTRRARFIIDGHPGPELEAPFRMALRLTPGTHRIAIEAAGQRSESVEFAVQ